VGARLLGLAFIVVLARSEDAATFASYNYLLVLAATVGVITNTGVALVANREVSSGRTELGVAYRAAATVQVFTSLIAAAGVVATGILFPGPVASVPALLWTALYIFLTGLFDCQAEMLRASGRPWVEASLQMAAAAAQVVLGVAALVAELGLAALLAVLVVKQAVVVIVTQVWLPLPWDATSERSLRGRYLRLGLLLGAASTCIAVAMRAGQLVLGNVGSTEDIADLAVATRYLEVIITLCSAVGFGLLPSMARAAGDGGGGDTGARTLGLSVLVTLLAVPAAFVVVPWATPLIFGERYEGAVTASVLFVAATPLLMASYVGWFTLVARNAERAVLGAAVAGLVVSLLGTLAIVTSPTPTVTALATLAGLGATAVVVLVTVLRRVRA
jgi:O-antigen/teichoic acid export membrane protein